MVMPQCRFCQTKLRDIVLDLGISPLANAYVTPENAMRAEAHYPLQLWLCHACGLAQLDAFVKPADIFSDYDYFSSYSESWLAHAATYANRITKEFGLSSSSQVVEVASNDGYLLQYFAKDGTPVLGIEPAANVAEVARRRGIPTENGFFCLSMAQALKDRGVAADLLVGNNVLAHVPDLNDFVAGLACLLRTDGLLTLEFPHLLHLVEGCQFDTIYHEHFSYFSLATACNILATHGLHVFKVEDLPTHGGSLRLFVCHKGTCRPNANAVMTDILRREKEARIAEPGGYAVLAYNTEVIKLGLLEFLIRAKREGRTVTAYGAAAKGNTLLNYSGVKSDFILMVADRSLAKQGKLLPGSRIPIGTPDELMKKKPDYVLILPWNLKDEIMRQLACIQEWGGRFVVAVPNLYAQEGIK